MATPLTDRSGLPRPEVTSVVGRDHLVELSGRVAAWFDRSL
jgi:hypothetical protein